MGKECQSESNRFGRYSIKITILDGHWSTRQENDLFVPKILLVSDGLG
jgi:hypothetical protein